MFKRLTIAVFALLVITAAKADEGQKVASKVQRVTVFLNGAQVTRTATVNIVPGTTELVFGDISPELDVQSIQVKANGDFTILSVKHEMNYLGEQAKEKQIEDMRAAQKAIKDKISLQSSLLSVYQQEETMLGKNQLVKADNTTLDVIKLKEALDFQTQRLTFLKEKQQAVVNLVAALTLELQKYDKQIAELSRGRSTVTSNILVKVSSKTALQSAFTLSYVVKDAGWYPTYDIRAKNVNSPITIAYKANVSQQSGEDWKNIKITLSTGNPTVSGNKQELSPYYLNFGMYYANGANALNRVTGTVYGTDDKLPLVGASIRIKGTSIGTVTDVNGNYSLQIPAGANTLEATYIGYQRQESAINSGIMNFAMKPAANQLNEVVVVGYGASDNYSSDKSYAEKTERKVEITPNTIPVKVNETENQTNIELNIDNPYSIPTDGKQYLVEVNQFDIKAIYQYYVAPKLSTDVFLTAKLTDWNKYNFLSGEANLFFEGTFIGKSLLDTHSVSDTLNLSLGTDKNIVVTRTLQKELNEKQIFGSNKKETKDWIIDLKNRKNQPVNLLVEDQLPVSQNSSIEVEAQETSGAKPDANTGKVSWNLTLNSQNDKKLQLKYMVKYPKSQSVIVQ